MTNDTPPTPPESNDYEGLLEQLIAGRLDEEKTSAVLDQLSESDTFLEIADIIWAEHMASLGKIPDIEPEVAARLEQAIANRITRADISGQAIRLGTQGFGQVVVALLRPFFGDPQHRTTHRRPG